MISLIEKLTAAAQASCCFVRVPKRMPEGVLHPACLIGQDQLQPLVWPQRKEEPHRKRKRVADFLATQSLNFGLSPLRQVIPERCPPHVLDGCRSERALAGNDRRGLGEDPAIADPGAARQIRILCSDLQPPFGTVVGFVPEAKGSFGYVLSLSGATAKGAGAVAIGIVRQGFRAATVVVEEGRAVADRTEAPRLGAVPGFARIFAAAVAVNIPLGRVPFEGREHRVILERFQLTGGVNSKVRQCGGTIAADPLATQPVQTHFDALLVEQPAPIDAPSAAPHRASVRSLRQRLLLLCK